VLTTDQKGAAAELAIAHTAAELGVGVFRPITDGERYDLIFDFRPRLARVQCKWARVAGDVLIVRCRSCRRTREGMLHRRYTPEEVDAIAVYASDLRRGFYIPIDVVGGRADLQLRLEPTRNHQHVGINWAADYDLEARLMSLLGP
jgi:hypothetical protein